MNLKSKFAKAVTAGMAGLFLFSAVAPAAAQGPDRNPRSHRIDNHRGHGDFRGRDHFRGQPPRANDNYRGGHDRRFDNHRRDDRRRNDHFRVPPQQHRHNPPPRIYNPPRHYTPPRYYNPPRHHQHHYDYRRNMMRDQFIFAVTLGAILATQPGQNRGPFYEPNPDPFESDYQRMYRNGRGFEHYGMHIHERIPYGRCERVFVYDYQERLRGTRELCNTPD